MDTWQAGKSIWKGIDDNEISKAISKKGDGLIMMASQKVEILKLNYHILMFQIHYNTTYGVPQIFLGLFARPSIMHCVF